MTLLAYEKRTKSSLFVGNIPIHPVACLSRTPLKLYTKASSYTYFLFGN